MKTTATVNLLGWFDHGNAGDRRIAEVMAGYWHARGIAVNLIDTDPLCRAQDLPVADVTVLAGGDHWHEGFAVPFSKFLSYLEMPFAVAGMGVDSITPAMAEPTAVLLRKAEFIWLRDEESLELLGRQTSQCHQGPDVTWIEPVPACPPADRSEHIGVNIRPWPAPGFDGVTMDLAAWGAALGAISADKIGIPMQVCQGVDDRTALRGLGYEASETLEMDLIRQASLVVSMRLHGLIFAAQAGVPMVAMAYQDKCRRFMDQIGMGEYCLELRESHKFSELARGLLSDDAVIRQMLGDRGQVLHERAMLLMGGLTDWIIGCSTSYRS